MTGHSASTLVQLPEIIVPGKRLGRHVEHDPQSRAFALAKKTDLSALLDVNHKRYGRIFDQGDIGSCTGEATAGALNTDPIHVKGQHKRLFVQRHAVEIYSRATELDNFPGVYLPDDVGSSGLAAAKAAKEKGYISEYRHAFSMDEALTALQDGPVITGVTWYEGFDHPDANGYVTIQGQPRGGHEFEVVGFKWSHNDLASSVITAINSWGSGWGKKGHFMFTVATWQKLLDEQGDVTILVR